jgi:hypothetical protein
MTLLLPLVLVFACALLARRSRQEVIAPSIAAVERICRRRYVPIALGAINAMLVWWMMGFALSPVVQIQDEAAYLLQAGIFAQGRWTAAAPPLPEFFAQMHVLTEPVLASKYPPGTSLFLTPFVGIGFPALGPMLLAAVCGALIFALARRVGNGAIAALAWVLWTTAPWALRWQATFLSQPLTTALWLVSLYCLLEYRERHRPWALIALAVAVGWCAITRPVTAVAIVLPVGIVALREVKRVHAWRVLGLAFAAGTAVVALLPLQNYMTTRDWRVSPLVKYSREYLPSDLPGFGFDSTQRVAPLPPDLEQARLELFRIRRQHTLEALPQTLVHRWVRSLGIVTHGWRLGLIPLILVGALTMPAAGLFAFGASLGLLLAYAFHAHWPQWSQYYLEAAPGYAFALAAGVWCVSHWLICGRQRVRHAALWAGTDPRVAAAVLLAAGTIGVPSAAGISDAVDRHHAEVTYQRRFSEALNLVRRENEKAIVFVRYGPNHRPLFSLVRNVPDLAMAPTWIAYERGRDDLRLMRLAPDRRAYIYHADEARLTRLPPLAELERIVAAK